MTFKRADKLCRKSSDGDVDEFRPCLLDEGHRGNHKWTSAPERDGTVFVFEWENRLEEENQNGSKPNSSS